MFGIVSRNPGNPDVEIPEYLRGRVITAWQISHGTADTSDFEIEAKNPADVLLDGSYRWPFALQPLRVWTIRTPPLFRELAGYTPSTHTQQAITIVQPVDAELTATLRELLAAEGEELELMLPRFQTMASRVDALRQRHPFAQRHDEARPSADAVTEVDTGTLGKGSRPLKLGHSQDTRARVAGFNAFRHSDEPQWLLHSDQPIGAVEQAIELEARGNLPRARSD